MVGCQTLLLCFDSINPPTTLNRTHFRAIPCCSVTFAGSHLSQNHADRTDSDNPVYVLCPAPTDDYFMSHDCTQDGVSSGVFQNGTSVVVFALILT